MSAKADGSIIIDTRIDTSGIDEGMKSLGKDIEKSTEGIGKTGEKVGEEFSKGFQEGMGDPLTEPLENQTQGIQEKMSALSGTMTKFGGAMSLAVTAPLTALGSKMVSSASDMEENLNKVNVAFGDSAEEVKAWADTATESFGLSKNQALEAASLFGDMGTSMGLSQKEASNMSTSLAGLAGDLASFKNIDIEQAMTALNGVFTGETESLKTLGVIMTETNLKQFAKDAGLVYDEMSQAEKVQLRYAYVMEMTKNAQGDYLRTADGTANSMRTLSATMDNLIAILGESLLPIITPVIQFITDLLNKFGELDPGIQKMIVIMGVVVAAIGPVITSIGGIITAISAIIPVVQAVIPVISGIVGGFNPVVLIIGAVIAAIGLLIANWDTVMETMRKVDDFLQNVFATDFTEIFGPVIGGALNAFFQNVKNIWNSIKKIFGGIIDFVTGIFAGDWEKAWNGIKDIFGGIWDLLVSIIKVPINGIIGIINGLVGGVVEGINLIIRAINTLNFDIPDWVPFIGGEHVGFNIKEITPPKIPYLANGAVIPPNAPFMAVLGDQKHGTNIEAPLSTIEQALENVYKRNSGGGERVIHNVIQVNRRTLYDEFIKEAKLRQDSIGRNPFELA